MVIVDDFYHAPQAIAQRAKRLIYVRSERSPSWQSEALTTIHYDDQLHNDSIIKPLYDNVCTHVREYSTKYFNSDRSVITGCWVTLAKSNMHVEQHNHIGRTINHISAIYYAQMESEVEDLILHPPNTTHTMITQGLLAYKMTMRSNRLIIFPGYLDHSFKPQERTINRVSVSFNYYVEDMPFNDRV